MDETLYEFADNTVMGFFWSIADGAIESWVDGNLTGFNRICDEYIDALIEYLQYEASKMGKELAKDMVVQVMREMEAR